MQDLKIINLYVSMGIGFLIGFIGSLMFNILTWAIALPIWFIQQPIKLTIWSVRKLRGKNSRSVHIG